MNIIDKELKYAVDQEGVLKIKALRTQLSSYGKSGEVAISTILLSSLDNKIELNNKKLDLSNRIHLTKMTVEELKTLCGDLEIDITDMKKALKKDYVNAILKD